VEGVKRVTGGRGVDVLLNSLPGDAIPRGLEVLAPCGRFVEIGKRDIDAGTNVSLSAFRRNATFSTASLDVLSPERLAALQTDVWNRLESGFFRPLPVETFPIERLSDAFLHMARAKHVGKIVLLASDTVGVREPVLSRLVRDDRTYLITGGLGDLGLIVARRLLKCGARHLVLVGRRPPSEHARGDLVEFRAGGAHVRVEQVDVAECGVLAKLLADISAEMPPLSGIVHCAGICDDAVVQNLDDESFRAVMSPKVQGSWNLHTLTGGLEFFVLFSSVAGVVGNAGQANYAAANAFMDALAAYRTSRGMPAQSIAWGAWRAGMATSMLDPTVRAIDVSRGGDLFERLIQQPITQVLAFEGSIDALCSPGRGVVDRAFISELTGNKEHRAGVQSVGIVERTSHAAPAARDQLFVAEVRKEVGQLAELPADRIGDDDSLGGLGIDSLGAIRLRSRLIERFGVVVSATALGPNTTTMQIASLVRGRSSPDARFSGTDGADVVSLRPHGIAPPVVFVHPVGGGTRCYQAVADALPYRALAIQAPALREGSAASLDTVERMAEHYLSLLSSAGVSPPLFLAGWSFGGLVAFEMARRLRSNGLSVPLVVLIDARLPVFSVAPTLERESGSGAALSASRDPPGYVDSVRRYLMEVAPVPLSDKRWRKLDAVLRECKTNGDGTESRTLIEAAKRVGLLNGMDSDDAGRLFDVFRSNVAAAQRYRPGVYEGQVLSFTAEKTGGRPGSSSAWLTLAPNTRTEPIDADHYSIISPPALDRLLAVLSPRLRERLS
jgi:thioesterase domain-containing protein/NAD(P)-dependent dehydrogenase (short-subunit alcohol dehydrogenase family)/acyl carrier protein